MFQFPQLSRLAFFGHLHTAVRGAAGASLILLWCLCCQCRNRNQNQNQTKPYLYITIKSEFIDSTLRPVHGQTGLAPQPGLLGLLVHLEVVRGEEQLRLEQPALVPPGALHVHVDCGEDVAQRSRRLVQLQHRADQHHWRRTRWLQLFFDHQRQPARRHQVPPLLLPRVGDAQRQRIGVGCPRLWMLWCPLIRHCSEFIYIYKYIHFANNPLNPLTLSAHIYIYIYLYTKFSMMMYFRFDLD